MTHEGDVASSTLRSKGPARRRRQGRKKDKDVEAASREGYAGFMQTREGLEGRVGGGGGERRTDWLMEGGMTDDVWQKGK